MAGPSKERFKAFQKDFGGALAVEEGNRERLNARIEQAAKEREEQEKRKKASQLLKNKKSASDYLSQ